MRKKKKRPVFLSGIMGLLLAAGMALGFPGIALAEEVLPEAEENTVYDTLKERIETTWDRGMARIEEADAVEITGNLPERILRGIAAAFFQNLGSIKAGSVLVGVVSFVLGGTVVLIARKNKKIQKKAVGICMVAVPGLLTVFVFGISWFVSIFR